MKLNLKHESVFFLFGLFCVGLWAPTLLAPVPTVLASPVTAAVDIEQTNEDPGSWILIGRSSLDARAAVEAEGGIVTHELKIIQAVGATLTTEQLSRIAQRPEIEKVWRDRPVEMASAPPVEAQAKGFSTYTHYPAQIGAGILHAFGLDGDGVTVAVVDTGYWKVKGLKKNRDNESRVLAQYDALTDEMVSTWSKGVTNDDNGHGTHVTGVIMDSSRAFGFYRGVAPGADLVSVKAFDANGLSTYSDVIRGIDWVVENKNEYDIRILNLSFGATPQSFYWDDPLNRAAMSAWREGIVVVTSAGNSGPDPYTINVPGNNPYVITAGAITDSYSEYDFSDDRLASFSAAGPTAAGWVKPDLVAYGGHLLATLPSDSVIGETYPEWAVGSRFYQLSGTSQAAAVTTGVAALLLQLDPNLSPDDVKCKLTSSALVGLDSAGNDAYNPLQQGSGLVNAITAVLSDETGCGNKGLDVDADLDDGIHWGGPVRQDDDGNLYVQVDGEPYFLWDGSYVPVDGVTFSTYDPWLESNYDPWLDNKAGVDYDPWLEQPGANYDPWLENYTWLSYDPWLENNAWILQYPEISGTQPNTGLPQGGPAAEPVDGWMLQQATSGPADQQE